jgi:hypothetical protein
MIEASLKFHLNAPSYPHLSSDLFLARLSDLCEKVFAEVELNELFDFKI